VQVVDNIVELPCADCGLCCGGPIYGHVPIFDSEVAHVRQVGLEVRPSPGGPAFPLPCPRLSGPRCTIYAARPGACRRFRCRLLEGVEERVLSSADARATIAKAKTLVAAVAPHLREGETFAAARAEWQKKRPSPGPRPDQPGFELAMMVLNMFLDRHFRHANSPIVDEEEVTAR